jgi:hypothetical protein
MQQCWALTREPLVGATWAGVTGILGVLLWLWLLTGCANLRVHFPYNPEGDVSLSSTSTRAPTPFDYDPSTLPFSNHDLTGKDDGYYQVKQLQIPSVGENGQPDNLVAARYYKGKQAGKKKLLIVLPIWGSYTYPSEVISKGIRSRARGATNVLMILGENHLLDWEALGEATDEVGFLVMAEKIAKRIQTSVIDVRRYIDWAETQPDVDAQHIGLIGFSVSALVASLVVASDTRLSAAVLVMGAANPSEIIATCEGRAGLARRKILQRFGWTVAEYEHKMADIFGYLNPTNFSGRADPSRLLMFDAHYDECMPKRARDALWYAMGKPERTSFLYGHKTSFLSMTPLGANYMRGKIYAFLDETL